MQSMFEYEYHNKIGTICYTWYKYLVNELFSDFNWTTIVPEIDSLEHMEGVLYSGSGMLLIGVRNLHSPPRSTSSTSAVLSMLDHMQVLQNLDPTWKQASKQACELTVAFKSMMNALPT